MHIEVTFTFLMLKFILSFRGAAGFWSQEKRSRGEHAGSPRTGASTHPFLCLSAGFHRTRKCPRLLELSAAGQVSWSQVSTWCVYSTRLIFVALTKLLIKGSLSLMFLHRTSRFASFPEYLIVQIKKFTFGVDWVPKKLGNLSWCLFTGFLPKFIALKIPSRGHHLTTDGDTFSVRVLLFTQVCIYCADLAIDVPDFLDLSRLRATGLQAGEEELPDLMPPIVLPEDTRGMTRTAINNDLRLKIYIS